MNMSACSYIRDVAAALFVTLIVFGSMNAGLAYAQSDPATEALREEIRADILDSNPDIEGVVLNSLTEALVAAVMEEGITAEDLRDDEAATSAVDEETAEESATNMSYPDWFSSALTFVGLLIVLVVLLALYRRQQSGKVSIGYGSDIS